MEFTPFQKDIIASLKDGQEKTVDEIVADTNISDSSVRNNLRLLVVKGEILLDKKRQPFTYSLNQESETIEWRRAVTQAKRILLNPEGDINNPTLKILKDTPRREWQTMRKVYLQLAEAIKEMDDEGKLIDTLEIAHDRKVPAKV